MPSAQPTNVAKPRAILNEAQAVQIFQIKVAANSFMRPCSSAVKIAVLFGISEKAVRDIWKGRTWGSETCHMDPTRPVLIRKDVGRPKGCKDSKPRASPLQRNAGVLFGVKQQRVKSMKANIKLTGTCKVNQTNQLHPCQVLHGSQQRAVVSYSVDDQLHAWAEGISSPSELIDPFRFDWVSESETSSHDE